MNITNHKALSEFLTYVIHKFDTQVCINDFVGFIPLDKELDQVLQPYMAHTNPFCMYIKSDKKLMQNCLAMKQKMLTKCHREGKYFKGICHAGAAELIFPIFYNTNLLGVINVGMFNPSPTLSSYLVKRACRNTKLAEKTAVKLFSACIKAGPDASSEAELSIVFNFIAEYLSGCFGKLSESYHAADILKPKHTFSEDLILSQCIRFITVNYLSGVEVRMLQELCHCSESYINHIFKKRTGYSIKSYVNRLRIEKAKELLLNPDNSIAEVALQAGFSDPDYFSRVFSKHIGIPPKKYRERFLH